MSTTDPQFLYMILVLPSLFGLTLLGEGINKIAHEEWNGVISVIFGFLFLGSVIFAFFFFSSYMLVHKGV
jgi:O-antigen/teichoic acid export membrane protein